ncbi:hypothetical protein MHT86_08460 [Corynebacterium mastitidis]|uniref:hypothetical protein n=1 Tax=Corynebacterium mastitidis TaxID=161890 RepID=UPI001F1300B9|nr:hypothetical protein [Corynebacterium mastitidis]MCH6197526.1 hypothetical protein [Corynebacterium mastitidis]
MSHPISAPAVRATGKPRRLTYHHIINLERVRAGLDNTHRALCGHTFAARYGILASNAPAEEKATWIRCKDCTCLEALQDTLNAREELALTIGRQILARLEAEEDQA